MCKKETFLNTREKPFLLIDHFLCLKTSKKVVSSVFRSVCLSVRPSVVLDVPSVKRKNSEGVLESKENLVRVLYI